MAAEILSLNFIQFQTYIRVEKNRLNRFWCSPLCCFLLCYNHCYSASKSNIFCFNTTIAAMTSIQPLLLLLLLSNTTSYIGSSKVHKGFNRPEPHQEFSFQTRM